MTIHSDHPFVPPEDERDPLRRVRGRMAAPVTVWAAGSGRDRVGLTVSSILVADGDPARVVGLIDPDSEFWEAAPDRFVVNLLSAEHRYLADAFAGTAPAPGGPFTQGTWADTPFGPALDDAAARIDVEVDGTARDLGYAVLVDGIVQGVEVGEADPLIHLRGRYRELP